VHIFKYQKTVPDRTLIFAKHRQSLAHFLGHHHLEDFKDHDDKRRLIENDHAFGSDGKAFVQRSSPHFDDSDFHVPHVRECYSLHVPHDAAAVDLKRLAEMLF
jgi:hypothetical protein